MKVGDVVIDDLTKEETTILKIWSDSRGNIGIKIKSDYLEGMRHPWEVTELEEIECVCPMTGTIEYMKRKL